MSSSSSRLEKDFLFPRINCLWDRVSLIRPPRVQRAESRNGVTVDCLYFSEQQYFSMYVFVLTFYVRYTRIEPWSMAHGHTLSGTRPNKSCLVWWNYNFWVLLCDHVTERFFDECTWVQLSRVSVRSGISDDRLGLFARFLDWRGIN